MITILVIEDSPLVRENISILLEKEGYKVISAFDGKSGVELALTEIPNLILCDIQMPELNGYMVLHKIRNNVKTFDIPFLFITANADNSSRQIGMNMGADGYVLKPFERWELIEQVHRCLNNFK